MHRQRSSKPPNGRNIPQRGGTFSNATPSNFLSRDACEQFGTIPKNFPHEQINVVQSNVTGHDGGQNTQKSTGSWNGGANPQKSTGNRNNGENPPKSTGSCNSGGNHQTSVRDGVHRPNPPNADMAKFNFHSLIEDFKDVFYKDMLLPMDTEPIVIN